MSWEVTWRPVFGWAPWLLPTDIIPRVEGGACKPEPKPSVQCSSGNKHGPETPPESRGFHIQMTGAEAALLHPSNPEAALPGNSGARSLAVGRMEPAEFDAMVRAHRPRVLRFLTGMVGDRDAAEDLTQ